MKEAWKWIKDNDVLQRVFALLMAVFMWAYVMSNDNSEIRTPLDDIPVRLEGVSVLNSNDLVILSGANTLVDLEINGPRSQVNNVKKDYKNIMSVYTYVDNITEPGEHKLEYRAESSVADVSTVGKYPETITVVVDRLSSTSVPVEVELTGELPAGFSMEEYSASPDAISVRGPETILRKIKCAKVVYDVSQLTTSVQTNVSFTLLDENGEEVTNTYLSPDMPSTTLNVSLRQQDSIPLTVALKDSPYLKSYMVEATIDPKSIKLEGDPETISEINGIELQDVDLEEVLKNGTMDFARTLQLPDGVSLVEGQKQFAWVRIQLNNCGWKQITLNEANLPESDLLIYPEQTIAVDLFGADAHLARLRVSDIKLEPIYELEDLQVGENVLPCRILLENDNIYVKQELEVTVIVTQEALDAALNPQPVDPDNPDQPAQPDENQ